MTAAIFVGPSLDLHTARTVLPDAVFLPPAKQADLIGALGAYQPDVIGLIDGSFGQSLSVWHKEILFALEQGVAVLGAASMGALRAAELGPFGMQGVGEVYRWFSTGVLQDDDEVAVLHAPAEQGFRPITEPMVNIRATLARAREDRMLTPAECEDVLAAAKQLHFSNRALPVILAHTRLPDSARDKVAECFTSAYVDVKRADARRLLETIRDCGYDRPNAPPLVRSPGFDSLYNEDRRVHHDSVDLPLRAIATYAALNAPDFDVLNFAALNRALVLVLADMLRVAVTDQDIEVESRRFRREHDLLNPGQLETWLRSNDITQVELRALVRERALCRRLHRWLLASRGDGQQTRLLLDELRLRGRYAQTAAAAAQECAAGRSVSLECESIAELSEAELVDLVPAQQRATSWRLHASMTDWAQEAGFRNLQDLAYELLRARRLRESRSNT